MAEYMRKIVYLSDAQRAELFANGRIVVNGKTVDYNNNDLYLTPEGENIKEPAEEGTNGQVLTTDGQGGRSWTTVTGGASEDIVVVSDTEPENSDTKLWITDGAEHEYQIPTYEEFTTEVSQLNRALNDVIIYPNLVNPSECTIGKYLPPDSTSKINSTYDFTNPITVTPGETLYLTHEGRYLQARNASNQRIDDAGLSSGFTQYTVPEGVAIVYITFYHSDFSNFMVSKYPNIDYVPYGEKAINEQYISSLIEMKEQIEDNTNDISAIQQITSKNGGYYRLVGDITANGYLLIDKMLSVQKNAVLSFVGNIETTFSGIEIGFTTDITQSDQEHFIITDTEIRRVTTSPTTAQHGITIKDQLCVTITNTIDGYLKLKIESNGQSYISSNAWRTSSRKPYVKALSDMTDCVFTWTCKDNSKDIALFGDSYLSFSAERWRYYLDADGYSDNTFVNSYAGENSTNGVINFDNLMPVISPKFLFWGYGMNDHDSNGTYNASWKTALDHVLEYCDDHGITPILATIPNVPQYDNTAKNTYIKNSGRRYIDFAKAVGAESAGSTWYSGMLASDNVHPTEYGAKALYARVLVDFPEIMLNTDEAKVPVTDVQVNGTSVVQDGVANVPMANTVNPGVVKVSTTYGTQMYGSNSNIIGIVMATDGDIKSGGSSYKAIHPGKGGNFSFYGLAKAAGDTTQSQSSNAVGTYTESAKSAISQMLNAPETVSGTTPSITAKAGVRYVCGEVSTLTIVPPASGCIDVVFTSGTTPTVLTITPPTGMTMKWANGFDPTSLDTDTVYEINILDGCLGVAGSWT